VRLAIKGGLQLRAANNPVNMVPEIWWVMQLPAIWWVR